MVDEIRVWPGKKPRCFASGSCHLTCDGDVEELHAFAEKLGLRREWFQRGRVPHYDLTPRKREVALGLGAVVVPAREQARRRIVALRSLGG